MFPWRERARHTPQSVDQGKNTSIYASTMCLCLSAAPFAQAINNSTELRPETAKSSSAQLTAPKLALPKQAEQRISSRDPIELIYAASQKLRASKAQEQGQQEEEQSNLLWTSHRAPLERAYEALESLQRAPEHGLNPERYAVEALYDLLEVAHTKKQIREFDELLTAAVWSYNEDLRVGAAHEKAKKRSKKSKLKKTTRKVNLDAVRSLVAAIENDTIGLHLESLIPAFDGYAHLQAALDQHNDYHLLGGWDTLPADMLLKPGDEHPAVAQLRNRLIMTDGLAENAVGSYVYDEQVQEAIVRFQKRHGLAVDGEIGPATLRTLNITSAEKVRLIGLNLARLRQLPKDLPADRISVNIPEFKLRMYRDAEETLNMGVVVGTKKTPTPAMRDKMRHLVFNPYWYPPRGITVNEILPKLRRDPGYLKRSGFELLRGKKVVDASKIDWSNVSARQFNYRVRQIPGNKNALGRVKFIFPNKRAIYLHDTPSRRLFAKRVRAFSHGCVRLEKPQELASALMNWDRGWTNDDVRADITAKKRKLRKFKEQMAIHLLYQTASVNDGVISFHPDIYGHDKDAKGRALLAPIVAAALPGKQNRVAKNRSLAAR